MAETDITEDTYIAAKDLPITFKVKYLGSEHAKGLWGIKHTRRRRPFSKVTIAKNLPPNKILPLCNLTVALDGVIIDTTHQSGNKSWKYAIDTISHGVQNLVYTRVFAMIIVKENYNLRDEHPFEVHAFVCDSRALARKLTYALAASFQEYSKRVKEEEQLAKDSGQQVDRSRKKFAIDLRSPEEMKHELDEEQETEA